MGGPDKVRVGPIGSDKVAHGSLAGGSVTSEGVCEAVRDAIAKIAENLKPTREKMEADGKEIKSLAALAGAASGSAELQASGKCKSFQGTEGDYHIYGACVSEIELDMLTGETTLLSCSILYDCGKSLNPIVDLGQTEGGFMGVGFFLRERRLQDPVTGKEAS